MNNEGVTLKPSEAHLASLCVAIVCGIVGGMLATWTMFWNSRIADLSIPLGYGLVLTAILSFCVSWIVCKYLFKSAHNWYGAKSWYHRIYDGVAIVSGMIYFLN